VAAGGPPRPPRRPAANSQRARGRRRARHTVSSTLSRATHQGGIMSELSRRAFLAASGLAVVARGSLVIPSSAWAAPKTGVAAPAFTASATTGKAVSLADQRGKIVVLEWTNHDCPYVLKHYETGHMQTLQKEATGQGVVWLTVISHAPCTQGFVSADA